jgi:uncharacterized protein (DUF2141 family)
MRKALVLWIALFGMALAQAGGTPATGLVVDVDGFPDAEGTAVLRVYDSVGNIVKAPPKFTREAPINNGAAHFSLGEFPTGRWAFLVFQDKNGNGDIDHGWNRFPKEPLGYSRGFVPGISAGMPTYGKAAVTVKAPADTIRVTVAEVNFKSFFKGKTK